MWNILSHTFLSTFRKKLTLQESRMRLFCHTSVPPASQWVLQEFCIFIHFEIWIYTLSPMLLEADPPPLWQNSVWCFQSNVSAATTAAQVPQHLLPSTSHHGASWGLKGAACLLCPTGYFLLNIWSSHLKFTAKFQAALIHFLSLLITPYRD